MNWERILEKWFSTHTTLTKANYEMFQEMHTLLVDEEEPVLNPIKRIGEEPALKRIELAPVTPTLELGDKIDVISGVTIYRNVLNDVIDELLVTDRTPDIINIIRKYHPNMKYISYKKYEWAYKKHLAIHDERFTNLVSVRPAPYEDKGEVLNVMGHTKIFSKVLEDFKKAKDTGYSLNRVIRRYYPNVKSNTVKAYVSCYKKQIELEAHPEKAKAPVTKRPPADAYVFNKTYDTYILNREVEAVSRALNMARYKYKPTVRNIADECHMAKARVRAVLHTLMHEGRVGINNEGDTPTYFKKLRL